jgi:hypothetical protein
MWGRRPGVLREVSVRFDDSKKVKPKAAPKIVTGPPG